MTPADHLNPYPRPRLMLLDAEPVDYPVGVVITAFRVVDGAGKTVTGCNSRAEADGIRDRYAARFPKQTFYVI